MNGCMNLSTSHPIVHIPIAFSHKQDNLDLEPYFNGWVVSNTSEKHDKDLSISCIMAVYFYQLTPIDH